MYYVSMCLTSQIKKIYCIVHLCRSVRVQVHVDVSMIREVDGNVSRVMAYFMTEPRTVNEGQDIDLEAIVASLNAQLDNWNGRGSGFVMERITRFVISIGKYRPLHGSNSSFVPTPKFIANKHCTVNVKNDDELCFMWAVLSALYPSKINQNNVYSYSKYRNVLNLEGLKFPLQVKDIPKFERQNPNIAVNVLYWDEHSSGFTVEYLSPERGREKQVNLLLLEDNMSSKHHYVWISDMSRLVAGRTKSTNKTYVCNSCLHPFGSQRVLDEHIPFCTQHAPQQVVYPNPQDESDFVLKFRSRNKQHRVPFYLVCDFESFLAPVDEDEEEAGRNTKLIDEQQISGFCCYRVTEHVEHQTPPFVYSGPDPMSKFYDHVMAESRAISYIVTQTCPCSR